MFGLRSGGISVWYVQCLSEEIFGKEQEREMSWGRRPSRLMMTRARVDYMILRFCMALKNLWLLPLRVKIHQRALSKEMTWVLLLSEFCWLPEWGGGRCKTTMAETDFYQRTEMMGQKWPLLAERATVSNVKCFRQGAVWQEILLTC